ncbi:DUF6663 family protein [Halocalculus aciditolerans]|uniref:Uncharacterized protein n=1 Tax=Halocalculus aciditolerans TaxID=1383812 RepID=A0A830FLL2_9EURY|nr:DUF6663 family protein [Halocalculus aciditolerans]GGL58322.1 hypothetical protein GCM10009039_15730 [Halocalculus aciditolerans]
MTPTTDGQFRVLDVRGETARLADCETHEPVDVTLDGDAVRPGYRVDAALAWEDGTARFETLDVVERTLLGYADGVTNLFEVALDVWEEAKREGLGVNARTTYDTDSEPNGAVYTFAEQPGERDVFADLRAGALPLEPLVDRLQEHADPPHEVFVLRPATHDFVLVYLVASKESVLANTVRDTYDLPRPSEPEP